MNLVVAGHFISVILWHGQLYWLQYKLSNMVKVFIAISPQGVITFISQAWGGRTSDKHSTGFCQKLLPGDIVLAHRGFDISKNASFPKISAFTKGCTPGILKKPSSWQTLEYTLRE